MICPSSLPPSLPPSIHPSIHPLRVKLCLVGAASLWKHRVSDWLAAWGHQQEDFWLPWEDFLEGERKNKLDSTDRHLETRKLVHIGEEVYSLFSLKSQFR